MENKINLFEAIYQPNENNNEKVKIFGREFIKKNKNKCKIIYKCKKKDLKEYLEDVDINYNHKDKIKIKIIFVKNIIDISFMFSECNFLSSLKLEFNNKIRIINLSYMFNGCKSLISLSDISSWNISKVKDTS